MHPKRLICLFLLFGLSACSGIDADLESARPTAYADQDFRFAKDAVSRLDTDSILAILPGSQLQLMPLSANQSGYRHYRSATGEALTLYLGRVVELRGSVADYRLATPPSSFEPLEKGMHNIWGGEFAQFAITSEDAQWVVDASYEFWGEDSISILGQSYSVTHIVEVIRSSSFAEILYNHFWVSPEDGFVYRSIQQYHPHTPAIGYTVSGYAKRIK